MAHVVRKDMTAVGSWEQDAEERRTVLGELWHAVGAPYGTSQKENKYLHLDLMHNLYCSTFCVIPISSGCRFTCWMWTLCFRLALYLSIWHIRWRCSACSQHDCFSTFKSLYTLNLYMVLHLLTWQPCSTLTLQPVRFDQQTKMSWKWTTSSEVNAPYKLLLCP